MSREVWKDIKGVNGHYQISSKGRVRNFETKKIRALTLTVEGYQRITLPVKNGYKNFKIHRLVAEAFIPNPNNLPVVNHIDANRSNNDVTNLEWFSHSANLKYAYTLKNRTSKGRENPNFKAEKLKFYHPDFGLKICNRQQLIKKFNLCPTGVSKLVTGKIKTYKKWTLIQ